MHLPSHLLLTRHIRTPPTRILEEVQALRTWISDEELRHPIPTQAALTASAAVEEALIGQREAEEEPPSTTTQWEEALVRLHPHILMRRVANSLFLSSSLSQAIRMTFATRPEITANPVRVPWYIAPCTTLTSPLADQEPYEQQPAYGEQYQEPYESYEQPVAAAAYGQYDQRNDQDLGERSLILILREPFNGEA